MTLSRWLSWVLALAIVSTQPLAPASQPQKQSSPPRLVARWDSQNSGVSDNLRTVFFLDSKNGWAAGDSSTLLKTTDGGATWKRLMDRKEGVRFIDVVFSDTQHGWLNSGDSLLYSSDGGDSWQPAAALGHAKGFGPGCVVGATRYQLHIPTMGMGVFHSDDGGRAWAPLPGKLNLNNYSAISFSDAQHGWLLAQPNHVATTADGGQTWSEVEQKISARTVRVRFVDAATGWAFGLDGTTMLGSGDGGKTWISESTGLKSYDPLEDLDFRDAHNGFVLSYNGQIIATADGGKHWRQIGTLAHGIHALSFPDPSHGWVVGDKGYIMHYHLVKVGAE